VQIVINLDEDKVSLYEDIKKRLNVADEDVILRFIEIQRQKLGLIKRWGEDSGDISAFIADHCECGDNFCVDVVDFRLAVESTIGHKRSQKFISRFMRDNNIPVVRKSVLKRQRRFYQGLKLKNKIGFLTSREVLSDEGSEF